MQNIDPLTLTADTIVRILVLDGFRATIAAAVWYIGFLVPFAAGYWIGKGRK